MNWNISMTLLDENDSTLVVESLESSKPDFPEIQIMQKVEKLMRDNIALDWKKFYIVVERINA